MEMEKNGVKGVVRTLEIVATIFSVITGAASVSILVWKGGAIANMVQNHDDRLRMIESRGSPTMNEHVKVDEEREKHTNERLIRLEEIYKIYSEMRSDITRISQKVDDIRDRMVTTNNRQP